MHLQEFMSLPEKMRMTLQARVVDPTQIELVIVKPGDCPEILGGNCPPEGEWSNFVTFGKPRVFAPHPEARAQAVLFAPGDAVYSACGKGEKAHYRNLYYCHPQ